MEGITMSGAARASIFLLLAVLVAMAGCSRSPEAKKARHLDRGDRYFAREQYREAVIEYANVLRIDRTNERAERQLALAHYQLGDFGRAFPYLVKFAQPEPDNIDLRLKLAKIYFLARRPAEAQGQVAAVLTREPKNVEAILLSAATATSSQEIDAALKRIEEARADFGDKAKLHIAAGDRKSTRLNSSHSQISYAVFCLKKKKKCTTSQRALPSWSRRRTRELAPCPWCLAVASTPIS